MSDSTWHLGIHDVVNAARENGFVIYGTGYWAKAEYDIFRLFGLAPLAFAHYNDIYEEPQDEQAVAAETGVPVMTLEAAAAKYPTAIFIRGCSRMFPNSEIKSITKAMEELNVYSKYTPFDPFRYYFLLDCCENRTLDEFKAQIEAADSIGDNEGLFEIGHLNNIIITEYVNISGSVMFSNLLKGHSSIVSLPNFMLDLRGFVETYANRLFLLSGFELLIEVAAQLPYLFISEKATNHYFITAGFARYFSETGEEIHDCGLINPSKFMLFLCKLCKQTENPSLGDIFKSIFSAYANTIGLKYENKEYYICYTAHANPLVYCPIFEYFDKKYLFATIREPVRSFYSSIRRYDNTADLTSTVFHSLTRSNIVIDIKPQNGIFNALEEQLDCIRKYLLEDIHVMLVRFEDLKTNMEGTIKALCKELGIEFEPILLFESVNDVPVLNRGNFAYDSYPVGSLITASSQDAMKLVDYGKYLNEFDIVRIKILTKRLASYCGYVGYDVPFYEELPRVTLEQMLIIPLKFEETLLKMHSVEPKDSYFSGNMFSSQFAECLLYQNVITELISQCKPYLIRPLTDKSSSEKGGD